MPGVFRIDFLGRSINIAEYEPSEYADTAGRARIFSASSDGKQAGDPADGDYCIIESNRHRRTSAAFALQGRCVCTGKSEVRSLRKKHERLGG